MNNEIVDSWEKLITALLLEQGLGFDEAKITSILRKLRTFQEIFLEKNEQVNLSGIVDADGFWGKHFYDSLVLLPFVYGKKYLDWGTGGGFPGVPLAIACNELATKTTDIRLCDSTRKKVDAVSEFLLSLEVEHAEAVWGRGEAILSELLPDVCTLRAVAPVEKVCSWISKECPEWLLLLSRAQVLEWKPVLERRLKKFSPEISEIQYEIPKNLGSRSILQVKLA